MIEARKSKYNHIEWLDLKGNGVMTESAIMKRDKEGNIYFFEVASLDNVDKTRLRNIIMNRNANAFELWDLMSQITLGNGINALNYFHQLTKVLTPSGTVINPQAGMMGIDTQPRVVAPQASEQSAGPEVTVPKTTSRTARSKTTASA